MAEIQHFAKRPYEKGAQFLCADFRFTIRIIYYLFTLKAFDARRFVGAKTRNLAGEVNVTLRVCDCCTRVSGSCPDCGAVMSDTTYS